MTLAKRLQECANRVGGMRALTEKSAVSKSALYRYIDGFNEPPASKVAAISQAAEVSLHWLITGEGEPDAPTIGKVPLTWLNLENVERNLKIFEEMMLEYEGHFTPTQKSLIIPLMILASEHEERCGRGFPFERRERLHVLLDYLRGIKEETALRDMLNSLRTLVCEEELSITFPMQLLVETVCKANINYFASEAGQRYYDRVLYPLSGYTTDLLQGFFEHIYQHFNASEIVDFLDLGCGSGAQLRHVYKNMRNMGELKGIDGAQQAVDFCHTLENRGELPQGCVTQGDIRTLPYNDGQFNAVHCKSVINYIPYLAQSPWGINRVFAEVSRVLRKNGLFFVDTLYGESAQLLPFRQRYSEKTMEELASRHKMKVLTCERVHTQKGKNPSINTPKELQDRLEVIIIKC